MEASYVCQNPSITTTCPTTCIGLSSCQDCDCATVQTGGGPWGSALDVIFCLLPILFLLVATLKPNPLPTTLSLPLSAIILLLVRLMYLGSDPVIVFSSVILGLHEALSPLTIMFGAMLLFETMESTLCLPYMMREMKSLTEGHTVAELMIIFSFAYMVEGASGFGTPAALGAPMLASLGYPKFESVVTLLLMNTFATVWGAAGTPIWFGFGNLGLTDDEFTEISYKAGACLTFAAYILLPTFVLTKTCPLPTLRSNALFLVLSISSVMVPAFLLSYISFEFPALIGGMVGCGLNTILIHYKVGMKEMTREDVHRSGRSDPMAISTSADFSITKKYASSIHNSTEVGTEMDEIIKEVKADQKEWENNGGIADSNVTNTNDSSDDINLSQNVIDNKPSSLPSIPSDNNNGDLSHRAVEHFLGERKKIGEGYLKELIGRTFPLWGVVLLLVATRIPQIGLKSILTAKDPAIAIYFGTYGEFRCSASLVLQLNNILTYPGLNWKYELLYIPFIMPFVIVSLLTMFIYSSSLQNPPRAIFAAVARRLVNPTKALAGALVMVQLLIKSSPASPSYIIGSTLADAFGGGWIAVSAAIGALGSFFSGSTTISNLTFGEIQKIAAEGSTTSVTSMLALQAAGASAGNGICLNNIIAACAVVGLSVGEGEVIKLTGLPVACFCVLATIVMLAFYFRF